MVRNFWTALLIWTIYFADIWELQAQCPVLNTDTWQKQQIPWHKVTVLVWGVRERTSEFRLLSMQKEIEARPNCYAEYSSRWGKEDKLLAKWDPFAEIGHFSRRGIELSITHSLESATWQIHSWNSMSKSTQRKNQVYVYMCSIGNKAQNTHTQILYTTNSWKVVFDWTQFLFLLSFLTQIWKPVTISKGSIWRSSVSVGQYDL